MNQPQINYDRVKKAVADASANKTTLTRPRQTGKGLRPVDAGRRRVIPAKDDNDTFIGILSGGVIYHD